MTHGILACCTNSNTSPSHSPSILLHLSVCTFLFACTVCISLSACTASHDVSHVRECLGGAHVRGSSASRCYCLSNHLSRRQKKSHDATAKESNNEPTARQTRQQALTSPQHQSLLARQEGSCQEEEERFMQQTLRETVEQCMHSEQLPQLSKLPQVCCLEQLSSAVSIHHDTNV